MLTGAAGTKDNAPMFPHPLSTSGVAVGILA